MKIKSGFVIREVAGNYIAVATGETSKEFNSMITLNGSGKFLFEALQNETTQEQLVKELLSAYDVPRERAEADVAKFVGRLREANLFE